MRAIILSSAVALLVAAPQSGLAQSREKPYCLQGQAGERNCIYESLERCQQMARVRTIGGTCTPNPALSGTTGAGGMDAPRGTGPHSLDRMPVPVR